MNINPRMLESTAIQRAIEFARVQHEGQTYKGGDYVTNHLLQVASLAYTHVPSEHVGVVGILHDVMEDTNTTWNDIETRFSWEVAEDVWRLTDEPGENRKERKWKTYWKIRSSSVALLVKLCDRYVNIKSGGEDGSYRKMYAKEHYSFKCGLWMPNCYADLWAEIDSLLEE